MFSKNKRFLVVDRQSSHAIISLYPDVNIPLTCSYQTEYLTNNTDYGVTDGFTESDATAGQGTFSVLMIS